jgi:adenosylmethionine-8-amino-7-oxononanoate aminotransferase
MAFEGASDVAVPRRLLAPLPVDPESTRVFEDAVAARAHQLAGIVVEPLVQHGSMRFHNTSCLRRIRAAADRHDLLLIFDESFTGFGRTGALFASTHAGVVPDIVVLANALTGGTLPLGAAVACRKVADIVPPERTDAGPHGLFAGNALACAAANASLDLFEQEPRLDQAAEIGRRMGEGLGQCREPGVLDVRIKGAVGVVEMDGAADLADMRRRFIASGVFLRPRGRAIALTPALTIEPYDLSTLVGTVVKVIAESARDRATRATLSPEQTDLPF